MQLIYIKRVNPACNNLRNQKTPSNVSRFTRYLHQLALCLSVYPWFNSQKLLALQSLRVQVQKRAQKRNRQKEKNRGRETPKGKNGPVEAAALKDPFEIDQTIRRITGNADKPGAGAGFTNLAVYNALPFASLRFTVVQQRRHEVRRSEAKRGEARRGGFAGGWCTAPIVIAPNKAFDVFPDAGF